MSVPFAYTFQAQPRVDLWFDNPNRCAAFFTVLSILLIGAFINTIDTLAARKRFGKPWLLVYASSATASMYLVAATYSRGGFLALVSGLLFLALFIKKSRRWVGIYITVFLLTIVVQPKGLARIGSMSAPAADRSITNRLGLWDDTLCIIHDNWLNGVGRGNFHEIHAAWYQNADSTIVYLSPVNDLLAIAAYWGLPALLAYLSIISTIILIILSVQKPDRNPIFVAGAGGLISYLVASTFSTFVLHKMVWIPFVGFLGTLTFFTMQRCWQARSRILREARKGLLFSFSLVFITYLLSIHASGRIAYKIDAPKTTKGVDDIVGLSCRRQPCKGTVVILADQWTLERDARIFFRPIASDGWNLLALKLSTLQSNAPEVVAADLESLKRSYPAPYFLIGYGRSSTLALTRPVQNAVSPLATVLVAPETWHPVAKLSPNRNIAQVRGSLLLISAPTKEAARSGNIMELYQKAKEAGVSTSLVLNKPDRGSYSSAWGATTKSSIDFLNNTINKTIK